MADFCHDWEPGGLGCYPNVPCSPDCLGDFTEMAHNWAHKLKDGDEILLGLCEGHGANVYLIRDADKLYIEDPANYYKEWMPYTEKAGQKNRPKRRRAFRMKVRGTSLNGQPADIESKLTRILGAYTRRDRVKAFKIGITNHPFHRFVEAYAGKYEEMILLYQTHSIKNVSEIKTMLLRHNRVVADNKIAGDSENTGKPPYYLYVVVRR